MSVRGRDGLAGGDRFEVLLLLGLGAEADDGLGTERRRLDAQRDTGVRGEQFLGDNSVRDGS